MCECGSIHSDKMGNYPGLNQGSVSLLMGTPHLSGPPKVTVVTPAFNVGRYIGEAVDSVMRQTFADFEYIVVDDGSTDNSVEVVRAHAGDDPRFRLVPGEHRRLRRGLVHSRHRRLRRHRRPAGAAGIALVGA